MPFRAAPTPAVRQVFPAISEIDVLLWEHLDALYASVVVSHAGRVATGVCRGLAGRGDMLVPGGAGVGGMRVVQGGE